MIKITKAEYYPWYKKSSALPWDRTYKDVEFLRSEGKQILDTRKWYDAYLKAKDNQVLEEVRYYVLPIKLPNSWNETIKSLGVYECRALSAIRNSGQMVLIGLFDKNTALPEDYSLTRIIKSRKTTLMNSFLPMNHNCERGLIIDDYEVIPPDYLYKDVPFDKKLVTEVLDSNLGHDKFVSKSLQAPLMGSPFVVGKFGGIGLASMMEESTFVKELFKKIQLLLPPEYRAILPPESLYKGKWIVPTTFSKKDQIQIHVAERMVNSNSRVGFDLGSNYSVINREWKKRLEFSGDYSFIGTIIPKGTSTEVFDEFFKRFTRTEITAFYLEKLKEADVYLPLLDKHIGEDMWLNIAHARQINPVVNYKKLGLNSWKNKIEEDWDVFLPEMGYKGDLKFAKEARAQQTMKNIIRLAQAHARSKGKKSVDENDLKEARFLFTSSAEEMVKHPVTQIAKRTVNKQTQQERVQSIKILLDAGNHTSSELWERLRGTNYYRNLRDFESVLDWLQKKNYVFKVKEEYMWL